MDPTDHPADRPADLAAVPSRPPLPEATTHDGLVLRRWVPGDAFVLDALVADNVEHLRGYMPWIDEEPIGPAGRRDRLETWDQEWRDGGALVMAVLEPGVSGDAPLGSAGLHPRIGPDGLEVGYWISRRALGRGLARRATEALTSLAFTVPGIEVVEVHHDLTNVHSRRIPEQLGFHHVGEIRLSRALAPAESGIELVWRIGREEWLARSGPGDGGPRVPDATD